MIFRLRRTGRHNDGSGIAVMLHLAEIFAADGQPPYTLAFIATDGEDGACWFQTLCSDSSGYKSYYRNDLPRQYGDELLQRMDIEAVGSSGSLAPCGCNCLPERLPLAGDLWCLK